MGIFRVDSPFYRFLSRFVDVLVLNFWLLVCSIPIVTAGASITAAFSVTMKMVNEEEGYITRSFFRSFKENFKQGTYLWLISLACMYIVYLDFQVFNAYEDGPILLLIVGILAGVVFFFSLLYTFPQAARYKNTIQQMMKNSQQITVRYFGKTIFLLVILLLEILLAFWSTTTLFFAILIGPVLLIYTISGFCIKIFESVEKNDDDED
jgi:uncharacterized membrane protein YesL